MRFTPIDSIPDATMGFVDGDVLRYRCGFAVEYTLYHVEGLSEPLRGKTKLKEYLEKFPHATYTEEPVIEPSGNAIQIAKNYLAQTERVLGCPIKVILSGKTNFRDDVATIKPYKGNRPDRKPRAFDDITQWFIDGGALVTDGIEADDLMAILANEEECGVICTVDKDLLQVPGYHYNFVDDECIYVDPDQGLYNLYLQSIMGDTTDNIQGIPKVGKKKAEGILAGEDDPNMFLIRACEAYEAYYGDDWPAFFNENAELVYMLRYPADKWEPVGPEVFGDAETCEEV